MNRTAAQGQHPSFGSVLSKLWTGPTDIPPFVSLRGMTLGTEPGFLGIAHRPFTPDGPGLQNLRLPNGVTSNRLNDRKDLLGHFDTIRRDIDATGTMKGIDTFTSRAFDMITSGAVRTALDLEREDPRVPRPLQGRRAVPDRAPSRRSGRRLRHARYGGWDTHSRNFKTLRKQLPELDRGVATLIKDLHERGMQDDVVTVMWGEFGRTPKVNGTDGGRDHWSPVMSALVAGGGLQHGPGDRLDLGSRRTTQGSALHGAAGAQHDLPRDRHRPGDDVPQRHRPADVPPRRPRTGGRVALGSSSDESQ